MDNIISQLKKERIKDDSTLTNLINKLYIDLLKVIKFKNKNQITQMTYEVPSIFVGYPLYQEKKLLTN